MHSYMKIRKHFILLFVLLVSCPVWTTGSVARASGSLLVANISNRSSDSRNNWIGTALAEVIEFKLSGIPEINLTTRYEANLILSKSGYNLINVLDSTSALHAAELLDVELVILGQFEIVGSDYSVAIYFYHSNMNAFHDSLVVVGDDLNSVTSDLSTGIVENLGYEINKTRKEALNSKPTENSQALVSYSRGADYYYRDILPKAVEELNKAVDHDPDFDKARNLRDKANAAEWDKLDWNDKTSFLVGYMPRWYKDSGNAEPNYHIVTAGIRYRITRAASIAVNYGVYVHTQGIGPELTVLHMELQYGLLKQNWINLLLSPQYILYINRNSNGWETDTGAKNINAIGLGISTKVHIASKIQLFVEASWFISKSQEWTRTFQGMLYPDTKTSDFSGVQLFGGLELGRW